MESVICAVCQAVSQAAPPDQRQQAGAALLTPVLNQLRDALMALGPVPPPPPPPLMAPGVAAPPPPPPGAGVAAAHPALNPLIDRLAVVFGHTASADVVGQMLSEFGRGYMQG